MNDTSAAAGETVAVPIRVGNLNEAVEVFSFTMELGYDPDVVSYAGFETSGTLLESANFSVDDNASTPEIAGFSATSINSIADDGVLVRVLFTVESNGTTTVSLENLQFNEGTPPADPAVPTFTVTSGVTNAPPDAQDDSYQGQEDNTLSVGPENGVLANDADPDGDVLTATLVSDVSNGSLTLNDDGSFEYMPDANFNGTDTFTYDAVDGGNATDRATVTLSIAPVNDAPEAQGDTLSTPEDETLIVDAPGVLDNDTDPDGDLLSASVVADPTNGALTLNSDGSLEYIPDPNFNGTDSFVYEAADGNGGTDEATVVLNVDAVNDAPAISAIADQEIDEDSTTGPIPFTIGDEEVPAESLVVRAASSNPALVPDGNLTLGGEGANRTLTALPLPDSSGSTTITLTVDDSTGSKATATSSFELTVTPVNDAPVAVRALPDDSLKVPGPPLKGLGLTDALFRDPDGDVLSLEATTSNPAVVSVDVNGRTVRFTPESAGTATITLTANDGSATTDADPFAITVVERPPGEEIPTDRVSAFVDSTGADSTTVDFGSTGAAATFQNVQSGGVVQIDFFDSQEDGGSSAAIASKTSDDFANVSPYRWTATAESVTFDTVDLRFRLADEDIGGVGDPTVVTILVDSTGDGAFEPVATTFDDGGTPADSTDDALVARGLTGFSTFKLGSDSPDNPLPVELTAFDATLDGSTVLLAWRTASETNNAGFEVQHQTPDAPSYANLGFVEGAGTTPEPHRYRFRAEALASGTHQFRLRQVDTDGTTSLSDPVTVTIKAERVLALTPAGPNPVQQSTQFVFTLKQSGPVEVTLYNVLGQRVKRLYDQNAGAEQRHTVDLTTDGLPSGTYFVRLSAPSGMRTQQIVVVR